MKCPCLRTKKRQFLHHVEYLASLAAGKPVLSTTPRSAALFLGYLKAVRTDNDPEFISKAFMDWAQTHGIQHILIQPGRPMPNDHIESINSKCSDEHLNESWLETLHQVRVTVAAWRTDYKRVRSMQQATPSCRTNDLGTT
jgi:transposase InsO family protein